MNVSTKSLIQMWDIKSFPNHSGRIKVNTRLRPEIQEPNGIRSLSDSPHLIPIRNVINDNFQKPTSQYIQIHLDGNIQSSENVNEHPQNINILTDRTMC